MEGYRTAPFGRLIEPWTDVNDECVQRCAHCGKALAEGETAYLIEGDYYCEECEEFAAERIFAIEAENYLKEVEY